MSTERPKAYYTAVFLQVFFRAIKQSMAGKADDGLPCWLDTRMLGMLCRELKACSEEPTLPAEAHEAIDALARAPAPAAPSRWQSATRYLLHGWKRHS